jgi:flagellar M-ring protein FliF
VKTVLENLRGLGTRRLILLGGIGAAVVAAIVAMSIMMSQAKMTVLYSELSNAEVTRMGRAIQEIGIAFDVQQDGTAILVAPEDAPRARMALAERGLPSNGKAGYELFDEQGALGLTSFMQRVTKTRALEGELARTIQTMDSVRAARVHIVMPDREAFSRTAPTPTASVIIRTADHQQLPHEKATAVQRLVAASVPNLEPSNVTVLDTAGNILAAEAEGSSPLLSRVSDIKAQTETRMIGAVEELLTPYLGLGNFRVMATADIDRDREVVAEEIFDPDSQIERSRREMSETESSTDRSFEPPVTVEQNLPAEEVDNGPESQSSTQSTRTEETINYELSTIRRERISEGGDIERLSVAVLVNGVATTNEAGEAVYRPRTDEELQVIANVVRTAVGFDEDRGDVVTVENVEFLDVGKDIEAVGPPGVSEVVLRNLGTIIQSAVLLIVVGLLVLFGLRPLLSRLLGSAKDDKDQAGSPALTDQTGSDAMMARLQGAGSGEDGLLESGMDGAPRLGKRSDMDQFVDNMIELRAVEGQVRESSVAKLGEIVEEYPDEAVSILRAWIYEERAA